MSAAGQKKGIFGRVRAKAGQRHLAGVFGINAASVSGIDRCYEPAGILDFVVAIPEPDAAIPMLPTATITTS
jgi:hypothetical protein